MRITYKREISKKSIREEEIIADLLNDRSITDVASFRQPTHPTSISLKDFGCEKELETTLSLLEEIKKKGETIVVYTDYDADGITGGSILWETLHLLGFKAIPYVPHRQHEGYGFSVKGIDAVKEKHNPALIISVDHGITAREKVTYAKSIGIPIIITDHHLKPEKIPEDAIAIFHFPVFSGSGLSYFFSKEIFNHFSKKETLTNESVLQQHFNSDYLALASIGTVADLVPLVGPSRSVVKYGLQAFKNIDRCGIRQILKEAGIENKPITTYEIGFVIAPRINAVGRLEHAIDAMRLLCTNNEEKARELAQSVGRTNQERQSLVNHAVEEATKQAVKSAQEIARLVAVTPIMLAMGCGYVSVPNPKNGQRMEYHDHEPNRYTTIRGSLSGNPHVRPAPYEAERYDPKKHGEVVGFVKEGERVPGEADSVDGRAPIHRHDGRSASGAYRYDYE